MIKISINLNLLQKFNETVETNKKTKIENLISKLKDATPVDTGKARDGWKASDNKIVNDVEYIEYLNAGSSKQAPAYFVEKTLLTQTGVYPSGTIVRSK